MTPPKPRAHSLQGQAAPLSPRLRTRTADAGEGSQHRALLHCLWRKELYDFDVYQDECSINSCSQKVMHYYHDFWVQSAGI